MQIVLKTKKEIEQAMLIEDFLKEIYPQFNINIKIKPIKRKVQKKIIIKEIKEKVKKDRQRNKINKPKKIIVKSHRNKKIVNKERKVYDISFIDFMEDKFYKEERYEDEMCKVIDKFKQIKEYQI